MIEKNMDVARIEAEIGKLMAETVKLNAEAAKMTTERHWYPFAAGAAFMGAVIAIVKLLH